MIDIGVLDSCVAGRTVVIAIVIARENTEVTGIGGIVITIEIGAKNVGVISALEIVVAVGVVVVTVEIVIVSIGVVIVTIVEVAVVVIVVVVVVVTVGKSHCHALKTSCNVMALGRRTMPRLNIHERKKTPIMRARTGKIGITIEKILQESSEFIVIQMSMKSA